MKRSGEEKARGRKKLWGGGESPDGERDRSKQSYLFANSIPRKLCFAPQKLLLSNTKSLFWTYCKKLELMQKSLLLILAPSVPENAGLNRIFLTVPANPQKLREGKTNNDPAINFVLKSFPPPPCLACVVNGGKERLSGQTSVADSQIRSHCLQPKVKIWKNRNVIADNLRPGPL